MKITVIFVDTESGKEYNLTFKDQVAQLRADLNEKGFFKVGDNMKYWPWFDRVITGQEFNDFLGSVKLYNAILKAKKSGKRPGNGLLN